ncbi:MAG TPA: alpha/beta hydrolase [Micromonosporaceae bacterium]
MPARGRSNRLVPAGLVAVVVAAPLLTSIDAAARGVTPVAVAHATPPVAAAPPRVTPPVGSAARSSGIRAFTLARDPVPGPPTIPAGGYQVGVRHLALSRGATRPLPTIVWYPTVKTGPHAPPGELSTVAPGRFPLILLSHGLYGLPESFDPLARRWVHAGFVVAAPTYPHTSTLAPKVERADIPNQPADASYVITQLLRLADTSGDPFAGHLDPRLVAAAGHSAGGYTTAGLLSSRRDSRVRAGIIMAGAGMGTAAFHGPVAPVLFLHGNADRIVSYARGRATFDRCPWPKAFVTFFGQGHGDYLAPGHAGFEQSVAATIDFLRWALYRDGMARGRLWLDATSPGVSSVDVRL